MVPEERQQLSQIALVVETPSSPYGHRFLTLPDRMLGDLEAARVCSGLRRPGPEIGADWVGTAREVTQAAFTGGRQALAKVALVGMRVTDLSDETVKSIQTALDQLLGALPQIESSVNWADGRYLLVLPAPALAACFDVTWDALPTARPRSGPTFISRQWAFVTLAIAAIAVFASLCFVVCRDDSVNDLPRPPSSTAPDTDTSVESGALPRTTDAIGPRETPAPQRTKPPKDRSDVQMHPDPAVQQTAQTLGSASTAIGSQDIDDVANSRSRESAVPQLALPIPDANLKDPNQSLESSAVLIGEWLGAHPTQAAEVFEALATRYGHPNAAATLDRDITELNGEKWQATLLLPSRPDGARKTDDDHFKCFASMVFGYNLAGESPRLQDGAHRWSQLLTSLDNDRRTAVIKLINEDSIQVGEELRYLACKDASGWLALSDAARTHASLVTRLKQQTERRVPPAIAKALAQAPTLPGDALTQLHQIATRFSTLAEKIEDRHPVPIDKSIDVSEGRVELDGTALSPSFVRVSNVSLPEPSSRPIIFAEREDVRLRRGRGKLLLPIPPAIFVSVASPDKYSDGDTIELSVAHRENRSFAFECSLRQSNLGICQLECELNQLIYKSKSDVYGVLTLPFVSNNQLRDTLGTVRGVLHVPIIFMSLAYATGTKN